MVAQPSTADVLALPPAVADRLTKTELTDLFAYFTPDCIILPGDTYNPGLDDTISKFAPDDTYVFQPANDGRGDGGIATINGVDMVLAPTHRELRQVANAEAADRIDTATETYVISNLLDYRVDLDGLNTSLTGKDEYLDALSPDALDGSYTHISGAIKAGYVRDWDGLTIRGAGLADNQDSVYCFTLRSDGHLTSNSVKTSKLGLKAISGVGPRTADRLRSAGYASRQAIAEADPSELTSINGIGEKTAVNITNSAVALEEGEVIHTSDTPLPGDDPVFIDIETDGLNPTITWLIGVQDGVDGNYLNFVAKDPDSPEQAVEAFMMWFSANARDRTLIAWNGWGFDYPVLREHIVEYCPEYLQDWEQASKRDPLRWATDLNNAVLPGRTNKLEHVAEALGWETDDTGLEGRAVARAYRRWEQERTPETELDWDRHAEYCEDDVKSMAFIYQEMDEAGRIISSANNSRDVEETTSQGSLSEF